MINQLTDLDRVDSRNKINVQRRKPICPKACALCYQVATPLFYDHKVEQLHCGRCVELVGPRGPMTKRGQFPHPGDWLEGRRSL
jgi:hypothetical protein